MQEKLEKNSFRGNYTGIYTVSKKSLTFSNIMSELILGKAVANPISNFGTKFDILFNKIDFKLLCVKRLAIRGL